MSAQWLRKNWFRLKWERMLIRAEAYIWLTHTKISDETFTKAMLSLRKDAMKWR